MTPEIPIAPLRKRADALLTLAIDLAQDVSDAELDASGSPERLLLQAHTLLGTVTTALLQASCRLDAAADAAGENIDDEPRRCGHD